MLTFSRTVVITDNFSTIIIRPHRSTMYLDAAYCYRYTGNISETVQYRELIAADYSN